MHASAEAVGLARRGTLRHRRSHRGVHIQALVYRRAPVQVRKLTTARSTQQETATNGM